jgi:hypothetical protein
MQTRYWRKSYFETLNIVAAEASTFVEWAGYAAYCSQQERGLRRQAFTILESFILEMEHAPFLERRRFVSWLLHRTYLHEYNHMLLPHPLRKRIIEPTLTEWIQADPDSSEPHRWFGGYEHLKRAIELDPRDEIACSKFVSFILGNVDYATHELPYGYLGKPSDDLRILAEAEATLQGLSSAEDRETAAQEISEQRRLIENYMHRR